jgi:NAD(P)-dependent dehydrogenase (short-subunit alcohol dehydrogenase family)
MLATHLAVDEMRGRGGAIVSISCVAGLGTRPHLLRDYAAAKAGIVRLTAALAGLAESDRIRVSCVCPAYVDTLAVQRSLARMSQEERAAVPPLVDPAEIGELVVELARDESSGGRIVARFTDEPGPGSRSLRSAGATNRSSEPAPRRTRRPCAGRPRPGPWH